MTMRRSVGWAIVFLLMAGVGITAVSTNVVAGRQRDHRVSVEVARDRAIVTQDIYVATLAMLHDRYFHRDKSVLPTRAMSDVFQAIEQTSDVQTRWISASLRAMNVDNTPQSDFEKQAAKAISQGTPELELVEQAYYRRAVAIPLSGGCLSCHEGVFQNNGRKKFAGLIVSIPLDQDR